MKKPTTPSTPDQLRTRAVADRIKAIMVEEEMGGTITITSKESAEWMIVLPVWSGVQFGGKGEIRLKFNSGNHEGTISTLGMVAAIRDNAKDYLDAFTAIFEAARARLATAGVVVDDNPPEAGGIIIRPNTTRH